MQVLVPGFGQLIKLMAKKQKQLILIVNNVVPTVNNLEGTHESVKEAWIVRRSRHKVTGIQGIWSLSPL